MPALGRAALDSKSARHSRLCSFSFLQHNIIDVTKATVDDYRFAIYERCFVAYQECYKIGYLFGPSIAGERSNFDGLI